MIWFLVGLFIGFIVGGLLMAVICNAVRCDSEIINMR